MVYKLFSAAGLVLAWWWFYQLTYPHEAPGVLWVAGALGCIWFVLTDEEKNS